MSRDRAVLLFFGFLLLFGEGEKFTLKLTNTFYLKIERIAVSFSFVSVVRLSSLNVSGDVDLLGQRSDSHLEAILDRFLDFLILIIGNEWNRQALGAETSGTGDTMEVSVGVCF